MSNLTKNDELLLEAAQIGQVDDVIYFLEKGTNINIITPNDETPLFCACENRWDCVVTILLEYKADIEVVTCSGRTALSIALRNNDWGIITQLVDAGADTDYIDLDRYLFSSTEKELLERIFKRT
uniref:Ankyrin repeat protein n=1 Tax=Marseillevirus LCMAC101 TaxID=2506602 RepID=A0A481YS43_9VIRU|nr:MAG: ankyrin repeat protein [Marseillevirus LCMAC101]